MRARMYATLTKGVPSKAGEDGPRLAVPSCSLIVLDDQGSAEVGVENQRVSLLAGGGRAE